MESISRISSLLESARELTLDASSAARSLRGSPRPLDNRQIKKLLDSRIEREVLDGLRRVTTMMYRGQKTLPFFSSVVKNVASSNLEIKKLVYIYVVHHAEQEPDLALLSINTIQKALSDASPQVRALALRTMSGIRVPVISQIVSLAIKKGTGDMSPYVRRAAALAIPKCHRLDPSQLPQLLENLAVLLGDRQYYVAGAAVMAFMEVCPERLDLVHGHYRSLVRKLVDMDEWSQLATLRLMTVYARKCFPQPKSAGGGGGAMSRGAVSLTADPAGFYDDYGDDTATTAATATAAIDPDLLLLLEAARPLLQSRNAGVVTAVARCYEAVGTAEYAAAAVGPLVALLRGPQDIQQMAMYNIAAVCLAHPADFVPYATHFLVRATDAPAVWELKLEVLALLFPHSAPAVQALILSELEHFSRGGGGPGMVREAVRAIGRCAQGQSQGAAPDPALSARCLRLLLAHIASADGTLAAESLTVIRHLIQQDPSAHAATVVRLAKNLDAATDPQARATIIWLVGEFAGWRAENNVAADVLRILLKDFAAEAEAAKRQIVLLAAKVYLHHLNGQAKGGDGDGGNSDASGSGDHPIVRLWNYVLLLVRYDTSYDLRDRTRLYRALLDVPQLASLLLLAPKPAPHAPSPSELRKGFTLGSAALVLGEAGAGVHGVPGYSPLPDWVQAGHAPDRRLRDEPEQDRDRGYENMNSSSRAPAAASDRLESLARASRSGGGGGGGGGGIGSGSGINGQRSKPVMAKTLDDWLAEEDVVAPPAPAPTKEVEEEEEEEEDDEDEEDEESDEDSEEEEEDDDEDADDGDEEEEDSEEEEEDEAEDADDGDEESEDSDSGEKGRLMR